MGQNYFDNRYIGTVCKSYTLIKIEESIYGKRPVWVMMCKCGKQIRVSPSMVIGNKVPRCECGTSDIDNDIKISDTVDNISPQTRTRLKSLMRSLVTRCYNEKSAQYDKYGGNGVGIHTKWLEDTEEFIRWSILNGYSPIKRLYRRNLDEDYSPRNCYWALSKEDTNANQEEQPLFDLDSLGESNDYDLRGLILEAEELGCIDDKLRIRTDIGEISEEELRKIIEILRVIKTKDPENKAIKLRKKIITQLLKTQTLMLELERLEKAVYLLREDGSDNTKVFNRIAGDISIAIRELEE